MNQKVMHEISGELIEKNNERLLSAFEIQPRYKPEFTQTKKEKREEITDDERKTLSAIYVHEPKRTSTQIAEICGFSASKSTKTFRTLEDKEMIKMVQIVKGKGISKHPVLLEPAYKLLNLSEKKFYGKGAGYEHGIWQYLIAEHFSVCKDYKIEIERVKAGKSIDVAVENNDFLIAIEVAMSSVHEKENMEKDFAMANADFVIVACKDKKVLKEVQDIVSGMPEQIRNKTKACLLSELLKIKPDELTKILRNENFI